MEKTWLCDCGELPSGKIKAAMSCGKISGDVDAWLLKHWAWCASSAAQLKELIEHREHFVDVDDADDAEAIKGNSHSAEPLSPVADTVNVSEVPPSSPCSHYMRLGHPGV